MSQVQLKRANNKSQLILKEKAAFTDSFYELNETANCFGHVRNGVGLWAGWGNFLGEV